MHLKNLYTTHVRPAKSSKGQALLFAVVAVTIALAIGVTVASRNIGSISRITRSDTSAKAYAAAEGGIERLLAKSDSVLSNLSSDNPDCTQIDSSDVAPSGNGSCVITFTAEGSYSPVADVKVELFRYSDSLAHYAFDGTPGLTKEISLNGYGATSIKLCWDNSESALYYYSYDKSGNYLKGGLKPVDFVNDSSVSSIFETVSAGTPDASNPFQYCKEISLVNDQAYGLRIRSLYAATSIGVFPKDGVELPYQGYKLTSVGKIFQDSQVKESKKVIVYRSYPYMPPFFDYAIFSPEGPVN